MQDEPTDAITPKHYAAYPRGEHVSYGSADRLKAILDGYYGLDTLFLGNIVGVAGAIAAARYLATTAWTVVCWFGLLALLVGLASYPLTRKLARGCGWPAWSPLWASILLAVTSP